jgi:hypothetical protein
MLNTDHLVSTSGTLSAGVGALLAAGQNPCTLIIVANSGVNPMVVKFGSVPLSATDGFPLDGASTAGGQGGSITLESAEATSQPIYGLSSAGTTFGIVQGTTHP